MSPRKPFGGIARPGEGDPPEPVDPPAPLVAPDTTRPLTVKSGCAMAWLGAAVLLYGGYTSLSVTADSSAFDDVDAADVPTQLQYIHSAGVVSITWACLLVVFAVLAFRGARWAATMLVVMAGFAVLLALPTLVSNFALEGFFAATWSVSSSTLVRFREPSRDWYSNLRRVRATP